jgi:tetratricopeptide (TPR) repeat protein
MADNSYYGFESHDDLNRDLEEIGEMAQHDSDWLRVNAKHVYAAIERGLGSERFYYSTVRVMLDLLARAMTDPVWKSWFEPLSTVVEAHTPVPHNPFQVGFQEIMREFRPFVGTYGSGDNISAEVARELLKVYIRLFKVLMFRAPPMLQEELLEQARHVARRLNDTLETARLNQTLALLYAHYGDMITAERYGKQAFNDYEYLGNESGIADAACTLAVIYRRKENTKTSHFYIDRALSKIKADKPDLRVATLFYEKGAHCAQDGSLNEALSYYRRALDVFEEFEAAYQIAMIQQSMALVYVHQNDFTNAEAMIRTSRTSWERLGNNYEWVNNHFAEAELELERGSYGLALSLLHRTIELARTQLEDTPARQRLIERIEGYINDNSPPLG